MTFSVAGNPKELVWTNSALAMLERCGEQFRRRYIASARSSLGFMVLHRCDNPPCVRWAHLFPGTNSINTQDAYRKKRR